MNLDQRSSPSKGRRLDIVPRPHRCAQPTHMYCAQGGGRRHSLTPASSQYERAAWSRYSHICSRCWTGRRDKARLAWQPLRSRQPSERRNSQRYAHLSTHRLGGRSTSRKAMDYTVTISCTNRRSLICRHSWRPRRRDTGLGLPHTPPSESAGGVAATPLRKRSKCHLVVLSLHLLVINSGCLRPRLFPHSSAVHYDGQTHSEARLPARELSRDSSSSRTSPHTLPPTVLVSRRRPASFSPRLLSQAALMP